jgi:hypothetical protein
MMVKVGGEQPVPSMVTKYDNKIIWAHYCELRKARFGRHEIMDGEILPLAVKYMRGCNIYPQTVAYIKSGRSVPPHLLYCTSD